MQPLTHAIPGALRSMLRDAPLWLLDEPTEGLDATTARTVLERLASVADGRSLVIATHIRREAALADRIWHRNPRRKFLRLPSYARWPWSGLRRRRGA